MHRYEMLEQLGIGSFGEVVKARSRKTNEIVAVKKLNALFPTWEACLQLRELKSLRVLRHENIVQLKEVIQDKEELYFVFEYMHSSLCKVMRQLKKQQQAVSASTTSAADDSSSALPSSSTSAAAAGAGAAPPNWLSEAQIRSIMYQLFCGLAHMHKHGFFHRDVKPENILVQDETLKIADLGQAREIRSRPPFTDYVATRWYRSPELLLRSTTYNSPIDLWACGCIMAELFLQAPLFPGSSEADQMGRICKVLGPPTKENWPDGMTMVAQMQLKFPKSAHVPWSHVLPSTASKAALQLLQELLQYDPSRRLTATQALQHRYFDQPVARPMLTATTAASQEPSKAEFKTSSVSYAAAVNAYTGAGGSSKKAGDDASPLDATASRWSRKDLGVSATTSYRSSKQTTAAMDKLFLHSPRESESSWIADAKPSLRVTSSTIGAGGSAKRGASASDSIHSARKLCPSPEDDDKEQLLDKHNFRINTMNDDDDATTDNDAKRSEHSDAQTLYSRRQSNDHLLQDLLDEFIA